MWEKRFCVFLRLDWKRLNNYNRDRAGRFIASDSAHNLEHAMLQVSTLLDFSGKIQMGEDNVEVISYFIGKIITTFDLSLCHWDGTLIYQDA